MPFGFPSGLRLLQEISAKLTTVGWYDHFVLLDFEQKLVDEFQKALFFSGKKSVDLFLEHRKEFIDVGKAAIAMALFPYEVEARLFERDSKHRNWYTYLYDKMDAPFEQFDQNKLSVITFNYDRSFEQFLFKAAVHSFGKPTAETIAKLNSFPIVHVHGKLGELQWQAGSREEFKDYNGDFSRRDIRQAVKKIKIISDNIEEDSEFKQAHELLRNAGRIYFLGFGYNNVNLSWLRVSECSDIWIPGTAYGLGKAEKKTIMNVWSNVKLQDSKLDVLDFFTEIARLD